MKKQIAIICLTLSGLVGSSTVAHAQSESTYRHNQRTHYRHTVRRDGKKKTVERTGVGAGAGAAVGAVVGGGKGAAIGAAAGGAGGFAYDRHKKNQAKKEYPQ